MKLLIIDERTKLPVPSPEALLIPSILEIWTRKQKIDGDRDGLKKTRNLQEIGFIYFNCVFDSRFRLYKGEQKIEKIKELLKLPPDWKPDEEVIEGIKVYGNTQITGGSNLVYSLEGTADGLASWVALKKPLLDDGRLKSSEVKDLISIINALPETLKKIEEAKETLVKELSSKSSGRKNRQINKFELDSPLEQMTSSKHIVEEPISQE
jgi:hypothetical protein